MKTVCCNSYIEGNEIKKLRLIERISKEDIQLNGCIFYNYPYETIDMKDLINNIDLFDLFDVYIADAEAKKYLTNTFGENLNTILVDLETSEDILIQKIIYQLFYFN